jgi:hypothetical protein
MTTISAVTDPSGIINVFTAKPHGQVFHWRQQSNNSLTWQPVTWMDGSMTQVAPVVGPSGLIDLFGVNYLGAIYLRSQRTANTSDWTDWAEVGGQLRAALPATSMPRLGFVDPQTSVVNAAVALQLGAGGGTPAFRWIVQGLPTGLSVNSATGLISGTPTVRDGSHL